MLSGVFGVMVIDSPRRHGSEPQCATLQRSQVCHGVAPNNGVHDGRALAQNQRDLPAERGRAVIARRDRGSHEMPIGLGNVKAQFLARWSDVTGPIYGSCER